MNRDLFEKHLDDLTSRINNSAHNELYIRVNSDTVHTQVYLNINKLNEIWLSIFHMKEDLHLNTIPIIKMVSLSVVSCLLNVSSEDTLSTSNIILANRLEVTNTSTNTNAAKIIEFNKNLFFVFIINIIAFIFRIAINY